MHNLWKPYACQNTPFRALKKFEKFLLDNRNTKNVESQKNVSTTRGVPSTSTNLKEALCEKIPIYYDLLRNFRRQHGSTILSQVTVDNMYQGLNGVNTMVREISEIDPKYGIKYRGLTIPEVVTLLPHYGKSPSPEAVFWLLLTGDVPTHEQTSWLIADWAKRREQRRDWWGGSGGGIVGSVLRTLPENMTPLGKLSVALIVFDAGKNLREALKRGVLSHTVWEYLYEDGMELLATLPAIVALVANTSTLQIANDDGDWINFLVESLNNNLHKHNQGSIKDFLRLYVTLNADENGGSPGIHVTEILGGTRLSINQALAAGTLAYEDDPKTGTMSQYMEFHSQLLNILNHEFKEESLKQFLGMVIAKEKVVGYVDARFQDPRYTTLLNFAKENLPDNSNVKFSRAITQILTRISRSGKGKNLFPEQNTLAAPIFQFYGLKDMKFNQVFLCMSRALGSIASIIWARALNAPVEQPNSKSTFTYLESVRGPIKKKKRGKYFKQFPK